MKKALPEWKKISHQNGTMDCTQVYDVKKKKLIAILRNVEKVFDITDVWRSELQKD